MGPVRVVWKGRRLGVQSGGTDGDAKNRSRLVGHLQGIVAVAVVEEGSMVG